MKEALTSTCVPSLRSSSELEPRTRGSSRAGNKPLPPAHELRHRWRLARTAGSWILLKTVNNVFIVPSEGLLVELKTRPRFVDKSQTLMWIAMFDSAVHHGRRGLFAIQSKQIFFLFGFLVAGILNVALLPSSGYIILLLTYCLNISPVLFKNYSHTLFFVHHNVVFILYFSCIFFTWYHTLHFLTLLYVYY